MFGLLAATTALIFGFILYHLGQYVKSRYDGMQRLVKKREKEIELLTELWKIDESEIEWIEPVSQGIVKLNKSLNLIFTVRGNRRVWRSVEV